MGLQRNTRIILSKGMRDREPFKRGNLTAIIDNYPTMGQLPGIWRDRLTMDTNGKPCYIVYSWQTPIAWIAMDVPNESDNWVIPDVTYSATTTHHQSCVRVEAAHPGHGAQFESYYTKAE